MIAPLHLGDDSTAIDLSTIDFGTPVATPILAPTQFDIPSTIDLLPSPGPIDPSLLSPDTSGAFSQLPATLPSGDLSAAYTSLMPTVAPASIPSSGPSVATDVAVAAAAGTGVLASLKNLFRPAAPAGFQYNASGQIVPISSVSPTAPAGYAYNAAGQLVSTAAAGSFSADLAAAESFVQTNWVAFVLIGSGLLALSVVGGGGGRRRRR